MLAHFFAKGRVKLMCYTRFFCKVNFVVQNKETQIVLMLAKCHIQMWKMSKRLPEKDFSFPDFTEKVCELRHFLYYNV